MKKRNNSKFSAGRITIYALIMFAFAVAGGGFYAYWIWSAPYRIINQFVRAAETGDEATLFRLSVPEERAVTHLTPQAASYGLRDVFQGLPNRQVVKVEPKPGWQNTHWSRQREYQCLVWWGDKATGKPMPGKWFPTGQMSSLLVLKDTREGWRIYTTLFLNSSYQFRWGRPEYFDRYEQMLNQTGMTGRLDEDNFFSTVTQLRLYGRPSYTRGTVIASK